MLMVYCNHMRGGQRSFGRIAREWLRVWRSLAAPRLGGYTVIEVLIVLGVTALLFFSAATMIVGRQNRTAFEQAIRNIHSQIQAVIDEVVIGHYPDITNIDCVATGSGPRVTFGSGSQGTNGACIFMGRVIQFGVAGTDPEQFKTYTIAGLRTDGSGTAVQSISQARPMLVAPSSTQSDIPDLSTTDILEHGLTTSFMVYGNTDAPIGGIAIWQGLPAQSGGSLLSGSQTVAISPIVNTTLAMGAQQFVSAANENLASSPLDDPNGIRICFVSGATEQSGLITIGGNQRPLNVTLDIKSNRTCS